jgi:hypothetical protein
VIDRLRPRLTFANVISIVALFAALGSGAYAAFVPRNSVGAAQLKRGSVGTRELRNHAIRMTDINRTTRRELRGRTGRPGPQGPAGTPATTYWAVVSPPGAIVRGNASGGHDTTVFSGHYTLSFPRDIPKDVHDCSYTVTIASTDTTEPPAGYGTAWSDGNQIVHVRTYNSSGAPTDLPFHIIVNC